MIVALLGLVIVLYASMLPRSPERKPVPDDFLDSVGDTLQQFADEIENENKELIRMVGEMKREHEQRTGKLLSRIEQLEKQAVAADDRHAQAAAVVAAPAPVVAPSVVAPPETLASVPPIPRPAPQPTAVPVAPAPTVLAAPEAPASADKPAEGPPSRFADTVKSRYKEVFELYDKGKSIEFIAKKLGKNKGEVQLIIGLAKQEEPQHGQP